MSKIICPNCRTENDEDAKFCISCGKLLIFVSPMPPPSLGVPKEGNRLKNLLEECKKERGWVVIMYHHIDENPENYTTGSYLPLCITPETFDAQMKLFSSENLWIASLGEVSSYLRQKETCTIQVKKYLTRIKIIVESEYDIPLTLKIKINWWKVKVEGSLNDGEYSGSFYLNVVPNKEIVICRVLL